MKPPAGPFLFRKLLHTTRIGSGLPTPDRTMNHGTNREMNFENNPVTNDNERNRQRDAAPSNQEEEKQGNPKKLTNTMENFSCPSTATPESKDNRNAPNPSQNNESKDSDDVQTMENATIDTQMDVIFSQYSYLSIFAALESGNMDKAKALIPLYPECLTTSRPSDGMTLLTSCARTGRTDACRLLLNQGVDVNKKAKGLGKTREATAIIMACYGGHLGVAQLLLSVDEIQVNQSKKNGATPLYTACQNDCVKIINALLTRKEIQINQAMNDGRTPLFIACQQDRVKLVNVLLARKEIRINQAMNDGCTPLYIACQQGHVKVVKALLTNKEIDINKQFEGWTPLKKAIGKGHTEIAALLQQHGAK